VALADPRALSHQRALRWRKRLLSTRSLGQLAPVLGTCYKWPVTAANSVAYPHIVSCEDVRGGEPVVEGTRVPVVALVRAHQLGMDFEEILLQFPGLGPEGLHAALLYYLDHRTEIEALIERDASAPAGALEIEI